MVAVAITTLCRERRPVGDFTVTPKVLTGSVSSDRETCEQSLLCALKGSEHKVPDVVEEEHVAKRNGGYK